MIFNSFQFALFFPAVTALYFLLPHRFRWQLLLLASCLFYIAFIPRYILILAVTIVVDYVAGVWLDKPGLTARTRRAILIASICSTCLVLFIFKYFAFFEQNLALVAQALGWHYSVSALRIILPIGLSFHTFQSLSYVIEVYRHHQRAEHHFGIYALYVMFYPQLVAGPIERPQNLLNQFREQHVFEYQRVVDGLKLMAWGLFKKVVIADRLAIAVNQVYGHPSDYTGVPLIAATIFFAFQIYCDFSGYSDIAIGAAQVMGFRLMDNFDRPYFSKSIGEFWKRWHISLSTWFRDYLYIPLGGSRVGRWRWQFNLFFTFLVSGMWHGANWTYLVWGALNGFYLVASFWTQPFRRAVVTAVGLDRYPVAHDVLRIAITFALTCVAWIFFRASTISDAWYVVTHLFDGLAASVPRAFELGFSRNDLLVALGGIAVMEAVHAAQRHDQIRHMFAAWPRWFRWSFYYGLVLAMIMFGVFGHNQFIYFQF